MYQWLKTMYDVVKTPTTTKNQEKNPPETQIAAILSIENMYQELTYNDVPYSKFAVGCLSLIFLHV